MIGEPTKATAKQIAAFEAEFNVQLPSDMRTYYESVGGTLIGDDAKAYMTIWPLSDVNPVHWVLSGCRGIPDYGGIEKLLPDANKHFVFMDHSIMLTAFAIRLSSDPLAPCPVVQICGQRWWQMADSFGEVLRIYREDAEQLL